MRGKNAGMFRESEKFSDSERQKFEQFLNNTYDDFITKVGKGRGKDKKDVDTIGQGRVWTGQQGKDRGLVDEYGGLDRAIEVAKQLAKIPAEKGVQRVIMPTPPSFFEQLMNSGGGGDENSSASAEIKQQEALMSALPSDVRHAFRYAQLLDRAKNEPIYMLPFDLRIR